MNVTLYDHLRIWIDSNHLHWVLSGYQSRPHIKLRRRFSVTGLVRIPNPQCMWYPTFSHITHGQVGAGSCPARLNSAKFITIKPLNKNSLRTRIFDHITGKITLRFEFYLVLLSEFDLLNLITIVNDNINHDTTKLLNWFYSANPNFLYFKNEHAKYHIRI